MELMYNFITMQHIEFKYGTGMVHDMAIHLSYGIFMRYENEVIHQCALKQTKKIVKMLMLCKKARNFSHE